MCIGFITNIYSNRRSGLKEIDGFDKSRAKYVNAKSMASNSVWVDDFEHSIMV